MSVPAPEWEHLPRDKFGFLPDDYCHRGECCGPGSWCCQRAGLHFHDDIYPAQWVGHPPKHSGDSEVR